MQAFDTNQPIYIQIMDQIKIQIISGFLEPGTKMASVRDLAASAGVNPNTMQRALSELEREGLLYTQRTNGRFVTDDQNIIKQLRKELAKAQAERFLTTMKQMGYSKADLASLLQEFMEEKK